MKQAQYRIKDLPKIERPREKLIAKALGVGVDDLIN